MKRTVFFYLVVLVALTVEASQVPDFQNLSNTKNAAFFLSTKRSGTNLISASLTALTHKPISWIFWKNSIIKKHPSYNRLQLPLISDQPLFYRTHSELDKLMQISSDCNLLIFVSRNPKELIFREFSLKMPGQDIPDSAFIENFLNDYLPLFHFFETWNPCNRMMVFYEDFICESDDILLQLCMFLKEDPIFLDDYRLNQKVYLERLLESYKTQHEHNRGGASTADQPQAIYYTKNVPIEPLLAIDAYLERSVPDLWEKYFKRFKTIPR